MGRILDYLKKSGKLSTSEISSNNSSSLSLVKLKTLTMSKDKNKPTFKSSMNISTIHTG